ncbi:MAG: hypothetical protein LBP51_06125 [Deferribacteraceae bacterium]|jgi:hypothetical protein|nr:hypothetical protein [Deferribacteraceae bacterium]
MAREKKSFEERMAERLEKASKPGSVVLALQSFDTRLTVNMLNQIDRQFRVSRDRLFQEGYEVDKIQPFFRKRQEIERQVNEFAKEFSAVVHLRYFDPMKSREDESETAPQTTKAKG